MGPVLRIVKMEKLVEALSSLVSAKTESFSAMPFLDAKAMEGLLKAMDQYSRNAIVQLQGSLFISKLITSSEASSSVAANELLNLHGFATLAKALDNHKNSDEIFAPRIIYFDCFGFRYLGFLYFQLYPYELKPFHHSCFQERLCLHTRIFHGTTLSTTLIPPLRLA